MTAIEASAILVSWILAVARLLRTGLPVLRLTDSKWALVVIALVPLLPQVADMFGAATTKLDLADAAVQAAVVLTAAVRGVASTDSAKVLLLGLFSVLMFGPLSGCSTQSFADGVRAVAKYHAQVCDTCRGDSVRSILSGDELADYELACRDACTVTCE
jgi:hypothetical protein